MRQFIFSLINGQTALGPDTRKRGAQPNQHLIGNAALIVNARKWNNARKESISKQIMGCALNNYTQVQSREIMAQNSAHAKSQQIVITNRRRDATNRCRKIQIELGVRQMDKRAGAKKNERKELLDAANDQSVQLGAWRVSG